MAPPRRNTTLNATILLSQRSRGSRDAGTLHRLCLKILRNIILNENRSFVKAWSKTSLTAMMYESGRIYSENYQSCYSCFDDQYQSLYNFPKKSKQQKIEDALLCQSPVDKVLSSPSEHKPCLLALTADSWICRISAETGKELQRVYLSPKYKFKYLAWNVLQETFYIKSIQKKETATERRAGTSQNTMMHLAVFHVFPLRIVGILEINKKGFGSGVTDVVLFDDVLAVSYSNNSVRLYSFEHIVQRYLIEELTLGQQSSLLENGTVGEAPFGIPVNIQVTDPPPILFQAVSPNGIQIGGYPWHYIYSPPQKKLRGTHYIRSLKDSILATNGVQQLDYSSLENHRIFFHPTNSGRIIRFGPTNISVLKIMSELNSPLPSEIVTDFSLTTQRRNPSPCVTVTSSGRAVKARFPQLEDDPMQETFQLLEYEDELDFLAIAVTNWEDDETIAHIQLHDNQTGSLQKKIDLIEPWDETFPHQLVFDRDTIIHIEQRCYYFCCHVYKLMTISK
ncbi:PREDICTED: DDB1- and CUL4-associated factor 17 isoform X2 [Cyprinodon variegatus]|nr:PREDICTED: DDB1- and CUL4-associated factor 17 isoform X1 [Cyprinodon variegatus]XP_015260027.1 PREDICTED: DDB1- and CUL4-associated factor 17 isoform X2 [Cyprinodon variegatus]